MADKVKRLGIRRDPDYMYFVRDGDVWRVRRGAMVGKPASRVSSANPELVERAGVPTSDRYILFLDKDGDLARAERLIARVDEPERPRRKRKAEPTRAGKARTGARKRTKR